MDSTSTVLLEGLTFPECPRWHDDRLWFSDWATRNQIVAVDVEGNSEVDASDDATTASPPASTGSRRQAAVSFQARSTCGARLLVQERTGHSRRTADLNGLEPVQLNEITVDGHGHVYVGRRRLRLQPGQFLDPGDERRRPPRLDSRPRLHERPGLSSPATSH